MDRRRTKKVWVGGLERINEKKSMEEIFMFTFVSGLVTVRMISNNHIRSPPIFSLS